MSRDSRGRCADQLQQAAFLLSRCGVNAMQEGYLHEWYMAAYTCQTGMVLVECKQESMSYKSFLSKTHSVIFGWV